MIYVFVDFEMNMIDSEYKKEKKICKSEIIEIGAVKLDEDYNEIDSFKSYVKPAYGTMASRIIKLTVTSMIRWRMLLHMLLPWGAL